MSDVTCHDMTHVRCDVPRRIIHSFRLIFYHQVLRVSQFDKREKLEEILNGDETVAQKTLVFVKLKRTADFLAT